MGIVVPVAMTPSFSVRPETRLFSHPGLVTSWPSQQYDVSADGKRFVVVETVAVDGETSPAIQVVQNWLSEFRDRQ